MSPYYVTYGLVQDNLTDYYRKNGSRMQFPEMINYLYRKNLLRTEPIVRPFSDSSLDRMTDAEFNDFVDSLPIAVQPGVSITSRVEESDIIPWIRDVFVIRHPRFTRPAPHMHNYFEINYVASGSCSFVFENEQHTLKTGECCMIAPNSLHDLIIEDEETMVFCIMIRKSTFNTTFFTLMTQKNLLSLFFRTVLQNEEHANYLMFYSEEVNWLTTVLRHCLAECHRTDQLSNNNCISWLNLFFSNLIRNYSNTVQFYNYQMGTDFSLILQYIQNNYKSLSLASLAEFFHYSKPYLSTLIRQNTNCSFTDLVKQLRMADAVSYLTNTDVKISEIADIVGYHSSDHFSRVFRQTYHMSPQDYRKRMREQTDVFVPFEELD